MEDRRGRFCSPNSPQSVGIARGGAADSQSHTERRTHLSEQRAGEGEEKKKKKKKEEEEEEKKKKKKENEEGSS